MNIQQLIRTTIRDWKRATATLVFCVLTAIGSPAQTFTSLLNLVYTNGSGPDSLVRGFDGNFYGVTWSGGNQTIGGSVFSITPKGYQTVLYNFCVQSFYCTNGSNPLWLMSTSDGSLYGTTQWGGNPNDCACGVVFKGAALPRSPRPCVSHPVIYNVLTSIHDFANYNLAAVYPFVLRNFL